MESYFKNEEEKQFVKKVIDNEVFCLGNEVQDLYSKWNESWFEEVENLTIATCEDCASTNCENGFCNDCQSDKVGYPDQEIFQWFLVSEWLAEKLIKHGEPLLSTDTMKIWGRTCYGQAIESDGTIQKIYRNLDNKAE